MTNKDLAIKAIESFKLSNMEKMDIVIFLLGKISADINSRKNDNSGRKK